MGIEFEWDPAKAAENLRKHQVEFFEAAFAFADPFSLTIPDPQHSEVEDRFVTMGLTPNDRLLVVVHSDSNGKIRIISARTAEPKERRQYEQQKR